MQRCSFEKMASQYQEPVDPACSSFFRADAQDLYLSLRYAFQHHFVKAYLQEAQCKIFGVPHRRRVLGNEYLPVESVHIFFHRSLQFRFRC